MMRLIKKIISSLSEDLRHESYKAKNSKSLRGFCYVTSEAFYYLCGDKERYIPMRAGYNSISGRASHWWLFDSKANKNIDITWSQFSDRFLNQLYKKGVRTSFLTKAPS